jgi:hypothetical protein
MKTQSFKEGIDEIPLVAKHNTVARSLTTNHLLADCKSPNGAAAKYLYFAAILLGAILQVLLVLPNLRSARDVKTC